VKDRFANVVSLAFHPLLMPTYLFLFIIVAASPMMQPLQNDSLLQILAIIFIITFIIPAISIGTLRLSNFITDITLMNRRQRFTPFLFVTCFYGITAYIFYSKLSINNLICIVFVATALLLFILTVVTLFWKISAHGAGIGGIIGFIMSLALIYPIPHFAIVMAALIMISGLVIYARLSINAHTPSQVYAGFFLGITLCYYSLYFFL
jgi:hypothetical protein